MSRERKLMSMAVSLIGGLLLAVLLLLAAGTPALTPAPPAVDVPLEHISSVRVMDIPVAQGAAPTEDSYLWTTGGAGDGSATYTRADWLHIAHALGGCLDGEGVVPGQLQVLTGTVGTNKITVGTGYAVVDGKPYYSAAGGDIALASAASNSRRYRITLRADWTAQTVRWNVITGTDAASPSTPGYSSTSGSTYDVLMYVVQINTGGATTLVADERDWCSSGIVDDTTITRNAYTGKLTLANGGVTSALIADNTISTTDIAANSIFDTNIGHRVPMLAKRQGGSSTNWGSSGTTTYVPGYVLQQCGVKATSSTTKTTFFPQAFSATPVVLPVLEQTETFGAVRLTAVAATYFTVEIKDYNGNTLDDTTFHWCAWGPE